MTKGNPKDVLSDYQVSQIVWRIRLQIVNLHLMEYGSLHTLEEKETCKQLMLSALIRVNEQALKSRSLSSDTQPQTEELVALSARGENLCEQLSRELTFLVMSA